MRIEQQLADLAVDPPSLSEPVHSFALILPIGNALSH
jgi:hypothetical protein